MWPIEGKLFLEVKMGKRKAKIIINKEKSDQKKSIRIPYPRPVEVFKDKKKYTRKKKHKGNLDNE